MARRPLALICLALMLVRAVPAGAASPVAGFWLTEKRSAVVELYDCGARLCGRIAWLAEPRAGDGSLRRDRDNPDPSKRDRPWCGLTVITGLERSGDGRWEGGRFYYPKHGRSYRIRLAREGRTLAVRAYLGVPLLGRSETWTPAGPEKRGCPVEAD